MQAMIPGRFHAVIQAAVASGRYASVEDAILTAIAQWAEAEKIAHVQRTNGPEPVEPHESGLIGPDFDHWLERAFSNGR